MRFHISLKICRFPSFRHPFENISNNDHTNICRDILNILIRGNDSGTDTFLQIIVYSHNRVRTFGTDQWVQRLVFRSIIIRHKFNAEFLAIMHIIQVDIYNGRFNFISTLWYIKKIWVNIRLLFNIVGKQIIFSLKMMIKLPLETPASSQIFLIESASYPCFCKMCFAARKSLASSLLTSVAASIIFHSFS